jgi:hypothetical protein
LLAPEDKAALLHERAILLRDRRQVFEKWVVARSEERLPLEFRARLFDSLPAGTPSRPQRQPARTTQLMPLRAPWVDDLFSML